MKYPYSPGTISLAQAVDLIREAVYPEDGKREAGNRIRQQIRYSGSPGISNNVVIEPGEFFEWAIRVKQWQNLSKIEGLPRIVNVCTLYDVVSGVGHFRGIHIPTDHVPEDYEALRDAFIAAVVRSKELAESVAELNARVAALEQELQEWRDRDQATRRLKSEAGKKGGRGRTA
jgi:uncharacterized small protein (DUF1192 family)